MPENRREPSALRQWLVGLTLAAAAALAAPAIAHADDGQAEATVDEMARDGALLLAGMPLPKGSPLRRFAATNSYQVYARNITWTWNWFDGRTLVPMRLWVAEQLGQHRPEVVFYPFSGPDILNAITFFPNARTYVLYGLEKVQRAPGDLRGTGPAEFGQAMLELRGALNHLVGLNFFRTASMKAEVGSSRHNGVAAMLGVFLARTGYTVLSARYIRLDDAGRPVEIPPSKWTKAVEIRFRRSDDPEAPVQAVYYFRGDISDHAWSKDVGMQAFVSRLGPMTTFLKAASYLMYEPGFDDIRATVLSRSTLIVGESSGVPFHMLRAGPWDLSIFGAYKGPIEVFPDKCQPDLVEAFAAGTNGTLPFSFGYHHLPGTSHLIIARRQAGSPIEVPEFDGTAMRGVRTRCESGVQSVTDSR